MSPTITQQQHQLCAIYPFVHEEQTLRIVFGLRFFSLLPDSVGIPISNRTDVHRFVTVDEYHAYAAWSSCGRSSWQISGHLCRSLVFGNPLCKEGLNIFSRVCVRMASGGSLISSCQAMIAIRLSSCGLFGTVVSTYGLVTLSRLTE